MASLNQSGWSCELRLQAWLCMFYLASLSGRKVPRLSNPELLWDHSRITPALFPERSGHASLCSGYAPGGSGSKKQREVGPKTERASVEISAENIYNSNTTIPLCFLTVCTCSFCRSREYCCLLLGVEVEFKIGDARFGQFAARGVFGLSQIINRTADFLQKLRNQKSLMVPT